MGGEAGDGDDGWEGGGLRCVRWEGRQSGGVGGSLVFIETTSGAVASVSSFGGADR